MYLLGFFQTATEAGDLDLQTIGGTWGTATSSLMKGRLAPEFQAVDQVISPVVEAIRQKDNLMANYLMKYFNKLCKQIVSQDKFLTHDAKLAYVVGCSWLKDVYVETDVLLGHLFEALRPDYRVTSIERFRRRHSGKDLHESIVYVHKLENR